MSTHTGTHLDAPIHFGGQDKWSVADIPLKNLINRPLAVIDVVDKASHQLDYLVTVRDLNEWEKINGKILEDSVIIIRTGWSKKWPNKLEYFGTETNDPKQAHFPGLHPKAAKWLVEQRQIVGIGIDGPSIDCGQCNDYRSHVILNENNIYILENLDQSIFDINPVGATLTVLPMRLSDSSGCPVRPIAQYLHDHQSMNDDYLTISMLMIILEVFDHQHHHYYDLDYIISSLLLMNLLLNLLIVVVVVLYCYYHRID